MATNKEFELITGMYLSAIGKASMKIDDSIKEAKEKFGFENGSALTDVYRQHYKEATEGIEPLRTEEDEDGCSELLEDENGLLVFDKKDALKMLKAIEHINTYIL
ncbi:MAG: hypothetical protein IJI96_03565 [Methanobrevibacter sp.]|nr:hypothetical protein [Methanobrevibacter sp.]